MSAIKSKKSRSKSSVSNQKTGTLQNALIKAGVEIRRGKIKRSDIDLLEKTIVSMRQVVAKAGLPYKPEVVKIWLLDDLGMASYYQKSMNALLQAIENHEDIEFYLKDATSIWGVLFARIAGQEYQVTKQKMRLKDINGVLNGDFSKPVANASIEEGREDAQNSNKASSGYSSKSRNDAALDKAEDAFWESISKSFPEISTGDIDPHTGLYLQREMEKALQTWLEINASPPKKVAASAFDWKQHAAPSDERLIGSEHFMLEGPSKDGYLVGIVAPLLGEWAYSVDLFKNEQDSYKSSGTTLLAGIEKSESSAKSKVENIFTSHAMTAKSSVANSSDKNSPTKEQLEAIRKFAVSWGKGWKDELLEMWAKGTDYREPSGEILRQIRNQFGPEWLIGYKAVK